MPPVVRNRSTTAPLPDQEGPFVSKKRRTSALEDTVTLSTGTPHLSLDEAKASIDEPDEQLTPLGWQETDGAETVSQKSRSQERTYDADDEDESEPLAPLERGGTSANNDMGCDAGTRLQSEVIEPQRSSVSISSFEQASVKSQADVSASEDSTSEHLDYHGGISAPSSVKAEPGTDTSNNSPPTPSPDLCRGQTWANGISSDAVTAASEAGSAATAARLSSAQTGEAIAIGPSPSPSTGPVASSKTEEAPKADGTPASLYPGTDGQYEFTEPPKIDLTTLQEFDQRRAAGIPISIPMDAFRADGIGPAGSEAHRHLPPGPGILLRGPAAHAPPNVDGAGDARHGARGWYGLVSIWTSIKCCFGRYFK